MDKCKVIWYVHVLFKNNLTPNTIIATTTSLLQHPRWNPRHLSKSTPASLKPSKIPLGSRISWQKRSFRFTTLYVRAGFLINVTLLQYDLADRLDMVPFHLEHGETQDLPKYIPIIC